MRSLEEIKIIKDFVITISSFENIRIFAGIPKETQIYEYINLKWENSEEEEKENIKRILDEYIVENNNETETKYLSFNTERMTILSIPITVEELNEYTVKCDYSEKQFLKEDTIELQEGLTIAKCYVDKYAKAVDDDKFHIKTDMTYIEEDDEYVYSQQYREENYRVAIDDEKYHKIENLTEVYNNDFYEDDIIKYVFSQEYLDENYVYTNPDGEYHIKRYCKHIYSTDEWIFDIDYLDENYNYCEDCGRWYQNGEGTYSERYDRWICDNCLDNHYTRCEICGEYIYEGDEEYTENEYGDEIAVCDYCYNNSDTYREDNGNPNDLIGSYHCNGGVWQSYKLDDEENPPFYMGFELEVEPRACAKYNLRNAANAAKEGINCILSHDGSLRTNGFEIVSQPQTYNYVMSKYETYKETFAKIVAAGYVSHNSSNCGLHFHVTAPTEKRDEIVSRLWLIMETYKEQFQALSRRKGDFHWCRFLSQRPSRSLYKIAKYAKDAKEATRYLAINDRNEKTIEIRLFRGTLNINTFFADLQLVNNLFTLAYDTETPIQDITFNQLIEGEYIKSYCEENDIYSDDKIVDNSEKYIIIEDKIINLTKSFMNITWKEINRLKRVEKDIISRKNIDENKTPYATNELMSNINGYTRNMKNALECYSYLSQYAEQRNIDKLEFLITTYTDRLNLPDETRQNVIKKIERFNKYMRILNEE